jgi:hypothetical protein
MDDDNDFSLDDDTGDVVATDDDDDADAPGATTIGGKTTPEWNYDDDATISTFSSSTSSTSTREPITTITTPLPTPGYDDDDGFGKPGSSDTTPPPTFTATPTVTTFAPLQLRTVPTKDTESPTTGSNSTNIAASGANDTTLHPSPPAQQHTGTPTLSPTPQGSSTDEEGSGGAVGIVVGVFALIMLVIGTWAPAFV